MLTELTIQRSKAGHLFPRPMRGPLLAEPRTSTGPIEIAGSRASFARNAQIYREKEPADRLYKVTSGTVRTCKVLVDGRRHIGAFYLPGETFGLEPGDRHMASAEAVIDAEVLIVRRCTASTFPFWDDELTRLMSRELQRAQEHLLLLIKTAPERVATFLLEMSARVRSGDEVELPMSRRDVADYLGLTIETVSRTLTQFENQSVIALPTAKRIVLRNRLALKRLIA
jgi:CRP/FNR family transcriptional regulator, nitrogen fixation regulation protein